MPVKVKEIKDGAEATIKVNKNFYIMCKNILLFLFQEYAPGDETRQESLERIMKGKYEEMSDFEKSFFTVSILIGEMEKNFVESKQVQENEIPVPGDPDYIEPTEG
jgi:hypothetical protein